MGFLAKLFNKKTSIEKKDDPNIIKLKELSLFMDQLLNKDEYIAKSEYLTVLEENTEVLKQYAILEENDVLREYCSKYNLKYADIIKILHQYDQFELLVDEHNDHFIDTAMVKEKDYLDTILKDVDPNITLDYDQRKVILTDEDYCLVIAGAGAGKTTTVAAKVKYLIEKKHIDPSQILVVSFTNKAVNELKEKLNKDLNINCPVATFHSTGNAILRKQIQDPLRIVDSTQLYFVIQDYFRNSILKNESLVNNLILFFASYFDSPYEGEDLNAFFNKIAKSSYTTMKGDLEDFKESVLDKNSKRMVTIQNEFLRSQQEVEIANFLYLNNIEYEYEPLYRYNVQYSKKPYTPDFLIKQGDKIAYIEHFGITEDGKNDRYTESQLEFYKKAINDKIILHRKHKTTLLYTFSSYKDGKTLLEHLQNQLIQHGFVLKPKSNKEVMEKLVSTEENRYIRKLVNLICRFIGNFKTNGYTKDEFKRMYYSTQNVRTRLFIDICNDCYLEYERFLKENNAIDFEDMINESARILNEIADMKQKIDFKYIIVDEYQDISRQRFDLVSALSNISNAKIIAVGDDWQSIYAFSGSDITLFTQFEQKMGYAKRLKIENTYRNSQEVIDIAGNFILKNTSQITKELKSNKHLKDPVIIYTYDGKGKNYKDRNKKGANYEMAKAVETAIEQIIEFNKVEKKNKKLSILVLGRFGFDGGNLERSGLFEFIRRGSKLKSVKYPEVDMTFMTAHASKGLGYDNVIIINGKNETYGFPSKIEDDPVLKLVIKEDRSITNAEERRLFYVAMTRTKNRVYIVAPEQNPSEFLLEIKQDYKNVILKGSWNEEEPVKVKNIKYCPICGFPLQYKYKTAYGLRLFICTNEPELCGFMTNKYEARKLSIMKCDCCKDGYLVVKTGKNEDFFLGCTNYKKDGTGCNNIVWKSEYYKQMNYTDEVAKPKVENKPIPRVMMEKAKEEPHVQIAEETVITKPVIENVMYKNDNLNTIVYTVLDCLAQISEIHFFGIFVLIDVLRGSNAKKIKEWKLHTVPTYASLISYNKEELYLIIEWLIEKGFILQTNNKKYPVLHLMNKGINYNKHINSRLLMNLKKKLIENQKGG